MRSAIVRLPEHRSRNERRQVLRAAIRQLERAEVYLEAVVYMDIGDAAADRILAKLRAEVGYLVQHFSELRAGPDS